MEGLAQICIFKNHILGKGHKLWLYGQVHRYLFCFYGCSMVPSLFHHILDIQLNNFPVKGLSTEMGGFACRQPKKSQFLTSSLSFRLHKSQPLSRFGQDYVFISNYACVCMATEVYLIAR